MGKLVNGKIDTPAMLRVMRRHVDWTATARLGSTTHEVKWSIPVGHKAPSLICIWREDTAWRELGFAHVSLEPPWLDNWRIHRPPSERKKRERVVLGMIERRGKMMADAIALASTGVSMEMSKLSGGNWTVYAERKRG